MPRSLKCDAAGCTHTEIVDEIREDMIGRLCPVCGESLLTKDDFDGWMKLTPAFDFLEMAGLLVEPTPEEMRDGKSTSFNFHDGNLIIRKRDSHESQ